MRPSVCTNLYTTRSNSLPGERQKACFCLYLGLPITYIKGSAVAWWLMRRTPDPEVGGLSPTRVKPCCVLEQGTFTPQKYWYYPGSGGSVPTCLKKLFTWTLRINQPTNIHKTFDTIGKHSLPTLLWVLYGFVYVYYTQKVYRSIGYTFIIL